SFNSLNLKEFLVPTTLEVGRIIRGFESPSTFNFIYLKYSGEDRIKASRCLPQTFRRLGDRAPPARRIAGKPAPTSVSGQSLL
ncbi:hypothetical protein, partial [Pseudomonas plecoglossicida]|uniref:hypothetical protein n=1 Tax=Pseudomonas plecoglossicida TaxID=70775 RepID=UPI0034E28527